MVVRDFWLEMTVFSYHLRDWVQQNTNKPVLAVILITLVSGLIVKKIVQYHQKSKKTDTRIRK